MSRGTTLVLGKHSGRHAVAQKCDELGFVSDAAISSIASIARWWHWPTLQKQYV